MAPVGEVTAPRAGRPTEPVPPAVVVGLDNMTGLQTARILARRGVPVIALAADPRHPCSRTRTCRRIVAAAPDGDGLIAALLDLVPDLGARAVLVPCTDRAVLAVSRRRAALAPHYHVLLPAPEVVETLMDKRRFAELAASIGLAVPATRLVRRRAEAAAAAAELRFPCLVKPTIRTPAWQRQTAAKAFLTADASELLAVYDRCRDWAAELLLQEWVPGGDADLYSCNAYFDATARPLATFVSRKLRQWPPVMGTSCLGEECRSDEVLAATLTLAREVGYHGLLYLEAKRDPRSGRYLCIEPNVGRPTGRSAIAEAGGVELLHTMYCDAVGLPLPRQRQQRYGGVKWWHLRRDAQSAHYYWRRGELGLGEWWRSIRGPKTHALLAWSDPVPFLADLWQIARRARRRRPAGEG